MVPPEGGVEGRRLPGPGLTTRQQGDLYPSWRVIASITLSREGPPVTGDL